MKEFTLTTPVALVVFNRPETTARVFTAIRAARPLKLLVVADGPRLGHPDDLEKCAEVRRIVEKVDWPCEVLRNYSDVNLGCKERPVSGLDWVFEAVEEAIILEDDCLPDATFFRFCQDLLQEYRNDERVMMICGTNLLGSWKVDLPQSYFFTHYDWVWGWASWRRAWRHNDVRISKWGLQENKDKIKNILKYQSYYKLRAKTFEQAYLDRIVAWDYQWACSRLMQGGVAIAPSVNLVANLGYGSDATHTIVMDRELSSIATGKAVFPLKHNHSCTPDMEYDLKVVDMLAKKNSLIERIVRFSRLIRLRLGAT